MRVFVALDDNDERVQLVSHMQATQLQQRGVVVRCPLCREKLRIRNGSQVPAHFAHRARSACVASGGESVEHMAGKLLLQQVAQCAGWETALEVIVGDGSQRIDVMLTDGIRRVAIEMQCSPLSSRRIAERTAGYQQLGFDVQWYLGSRYLNDRTAAGRIKFATLHDDGLRLQYCDVAHKKLIVDTAVTLSSWQRTVTWPIHGRPVSCGQSRSERSRAEKLAQQLRLARVGKVRAVQTYCYEHGRHLAGCPWVVHQALGVRPGFDLPEDLLRVVWLIEFADGPISFARNASFWINHAALAQLPLVNTTAYCRDVAAIFPTLLVQQGYLAHTKTGWRWLRQPEWYADIDQKMCDI